MKERVVVALGGNAVIKKGQRGEKEEQFSNIANSVIGIIELAKRGYYIVVTHGNGPQVGNQLIRAEHAPSEVPREPLEICVADTQGSMGYMIVQTLRNGLSAVGVEAFPVSIVTQVVVDEKDPSFKNPTKPVGPFYTKEEAEKKRKNGWAVVEDAGRGYRRVVPSPTPIQTVEKDCINFLLDNSALVIASGGGGIPVVREKNRLVGVDAVIDKDLASALLAREIKAKKLIILTYIERVAVNFGKPNQKNIDKMTLDEATRYMKEGHFPPGSMGPKIQAAINFLSSGGEEVLICSTDKFIEALDGKSGTTITK